MSDVLTLTPSDVRSEAPSASLVQDRIPEARIRRRGPLAESVLVGSERRETEFRGSIAAISRYRELSPDWDKYGGIPAGESPAAFAICLLDEIISTPEVWAPLVRPISGGVYIEWRHGDSLLYFEVDDVSVLRYVRNTYGERTVEDSTFDVDLAKEAVISFVQNSA